MRETRVTMKRLQYVTLHSINKAEDTTRHCGASVIMKVDENTAFNPTQRIHLMLMLCTFSCITTA